MKDPSPEQVKKFIKIVKAGARFYDLHKDPDADLVEVMGWLECYSEKTWPYEDPRFTLAGKITLLKSEFGWSAMWEGPEEDLTWGITEVSSPIGAVCYLLGQLEDNGAICKST